MSKLPTKFKQYQIGCQQISDPSKPLQSHYPNLESNASDDGLRLKPYCDVGNGSKDSDGFDFNRECRCSGEEMFSKNESVGAPSHSPSLLEYTRKLRSVMETSSDLQVERDCSNHKEATATIKREPSSSSLLRDRGNENNVTHKENLTVVQNVQELNTILIEMSTKLQKDLKNATRTTEILQDALTNSNNSLQTLQVDMETMRLNTSASINDELQLQITEKDQMENLEIKLRESLEERERLKIANSDLEMKISNLDQNVLNHRLPRIVEDLQIKNDEKNIKLIELRSTVNSYKMENDRLNAHVQALESKLKEAANLAGLEMINNDLHSKVEELELLIKMKDSELNECKTIATMHRSDNVVLKKNIKELSEKLKISMEAERPQTSKTCTDISSMFPETIKELQNDISKKNQELQEIRAKANKYHSEQTTTSNLLNKLKKQCNQSAMDDETRSRLKAQISELNAQMQNRIDLLQPLRRKESECAKGINSLEKRITELKTQMKTNSTDKALLKVCLTESQVLQSQITKHEIQVKSLQENIQNHQSENNELKKRIKQLEMTPVVQPLLPPQRDTNNHMSAETSITQLNSLQRDINKCLSEKHLLINQLALVESQLNEPMKGGDTFAKVKELKGEIQIKDSKLNKCLKESSGLLKQLSSSEGHVKEHDNQQASPFDTTNSKISAKIAELERSMSEKNAQLENLQKDINKYQSERDKMKNRLAALMKQVSIKEEMREMEKEIDEKDTKLKAVLKESNKIRIQKQQSQNHAKELTRRRAEIVSDIAEIKNVDLVTKSYVFTKLEELALQLEEANSRLVIIRKEVGQHVSEKTYLTNRIKEIENQQSSQSDETLLKRFQQLETKMASKESQLKAIKKEASKYQSENVELNKRVEALKNESLPNHQLSAIANNAGKCEISALQSEIYRLNDEREILIKNFDETLQKVREESETSKLEQERETEGLKRKNRDLEEQLSTCRSAIDEIVES